MTKIKKHGAPHAVKYAKCVVKKGTNGLAYTVYLNVLGEEIQAEAKENKQGIPVRNGADLRKKFSTEQRRLHS